MLLGKLIEEMMDDTILRRCEGGCEERRPVVDARLIPI